MDTAEAIRRYIELTRDPQTQRHIQGTVRTTALKHEVNRGEPIDPQAWERFKKDFQENEPTIFAILDRSGILKNLAPAGDVTIQTDTSNEEEGSLPSSSMTFSSKDDNAEPVQNPNPGHKGVSVAEDSHPDTTAPDPQEPGSQREHRADSEPMIEDNPELFSETDEEFQKILKLWGNFTRFEEFKISLLRIASAHLDINKKYEHQEKRRIDEFEGEVCDIHSQLIRNAEQFAHMEKFVSLRLAAKNPDSTPQPEPVPVSTSRANSTPLNPSEGVKRFLSSIPDIFHLLPIFLWYKITSEEHLHTIAKMPAEYISQWLGKLREEKIIDLYEAVVLTKKFAKLAKSG